MTGKISRLSVVSGCVAVLSTITAAAMAQVLEQTPVQIPGQPTQAGAIVPPILVTEVDVNPDGRGLVQTARISLPADLFENPPPQDTPPVVVEISIAEGTTVQLEETRRIIRDGRTAIIGRDRTQAHSTFLFIREGGSLQSGRIERVDQVITLTGPKPLGGRITFKMVIWQPSEIPNELKPNDAAAPANDSGVPADTPPPETSAQDSPTGPIEINLMVVYTPMAAAKSFEDLEEKISKTIKDIVGNAAMRMEDQAGVRLQLVHVQEVDYEEATSMSIDLDRLECPCDHMREGIGDNHLNDVFIPWTRKEVDIVSLWVHSTTESGYGNLMSTVSSEWAPRAVHVVSWDAAVAAKSFDHELGHQFGARHDRASDPTDYRPYVFNHGYVNPNFNQVTIMAYRSSCSVSVECMRRGIWSDPDYAPAGYWGAASGPNAADNVRTLQESAKTVSEFKTKHHLVGCCIEEGTYFNRIYRPGPCSRPTNEDPN